MDKVHLTHPAHTLDSQLEEINSHRSWKEGQGETRSHFPSQVVVGSGFPHLSWAMMISNDIGGHLEDSSSKRLQLHSVYFHYYQLLESGDFHRNLPISLHNFSSSSFPTFCVFVVLMRMTREIVCGMRRMESSGNDEMKPTNWHHFPNPSSPVVNPGELERKPWRRRHGLISAPRKSLILEQVTCTLTWAEGLRSRIYVGVDRSREPGGVWGWHYKDKRLPLIERPRSVPSLILFNTHRRAWSMPARPQEPRSSPAAKVSGSQAESKEIKTVNVEMSPQLKRGESFGSAPRGWLRFWRK